jgi:hypothetical protein
MEATGERVMSTQFFRNNCAGFLYTATQLNAFCYCVLGTVQMQPSPICQPPRSTQRTPSAPSPYRCVPEGKHRTMRLVDNDHAQSQQFLVNVSMIFI